MSNVPQSNYEDIPADEMKELMDEMTASETKAEDWGWGEPISVYRDTEAVDDGTLVDLSQFPLVSFRGLPINRMTDHLFADLKPFVEAEMPAFDGSFGRTIASILRTKCKFAQGDPGNTGEVGDIYRIPPNLRLVMNEGGGWTAMHPEDY
ncbi:MAG: hypothetical protein ROO76_07295 [Terriglobia bacterium]|nr:hypothetical protein [Terriglobia bacterium]